MILKRALSVSQTMDPMMTTPSEYLELYDAARGDEFSKYHGYAYDGVWVVAKALDRLLDDVAVAPEDFRGALVGKVLNETAFLGVTGRVQFLNGDRLGSTTILQMQYGSMLKVGEYHALTDTLDLSLGEPIVWIDGHPPVDRSIKIEELRRVSFPVYVGFVVMAALGITMAAFFLALNIRFRRHRYIKMSSPNMNNLIIVGSILCYVSVILLGAEPGHKNRELFSYWCTARSWTLALGFTLAFGAMFGKTWRVHAIFTNIKLNKKVIKDYKLMLIVLVLVLVDASILVTWQIVDPFDKAVKRMSPEVYEDFEIIARIDYCSSQYMEIWLGALYAYKGLLLGATIGTSFVNIKADNFWKILAPLKCLLDTSVLQELKHDYASLLSHKTVKFFTITNMKISR
ncbi:gamma-aminobutyric acid type b receptor [Plakobranchus ocellatus]|uniref:Gamma-aminobutyric acid type b receptor n=1 Tax=Plakobranchus ocellatus TaxID=259542 RepID=A0AAV3ZD92_9GAST|nr:gamma-aminobutyric acid type b receptor [Plakobranchus ocellatus]